MSRELILLLDLQCNRTPKEYGALIGVVLDRAAESMDGCHVFVEQGTMLGEYRRSGNGSVIKLAIHPHPSKARTKNS